MNKMRARAIDRPTFFVAHSLGGLVCEQVTNS
jgi:predicted alpha/beta hydrolase family esterase